MKQMKSLFIAVALMFGVSQFASAQKVAHINMQELIENHPEMATARKMLQDMGERYEKDFTEMYNEYNAKLQKYMAEEESVSQAVNEERGRELQDMQRNIQEFGANARKSIEEKEAELVVPIVEKATEIVRKVARAKGYEYVLDATVPGTVLLADGPNLLEDVKKELGI